MINIIACFKVDVDNEKVAYTLVKAMLEHGWDNPEFRDKRVRFMGVRGPSDINKPNPYVGWDKW